MPASLPTDRLIRRLPEVGALSRFARLLCVLFTGTLASLLFSFASQLILARILLPDDLGRLVALLAVVNFRPWPAGV
jgi:hypothetical protein